MFSLLDFVWLRYTGPRQRGSPSLPHMLVFELRLGTTFCNCEWRRGALSETDGHRFCRASGEGCQRPQAEGHSPAFRRNDCDLIGRFGTCMFLRPL